MFHNQASCSESTTKNRDQKPSRFHSRRCLELLLLMALGCSVAAAQCNVYVADRETNSVSVFNTLNNSLMAMVPVGNQPLRVAITPNGAFAYVVNTTHLGLITSNTVSVINTATNSVVATIPVGGCLLPGREIGVLPNNSTTVSPTRTTRPAGRYAGPRPPAGRVPMEDLTLVIDHEAWT